MRQDFVTFPPTHKLVIYGNHTPKLRTSMRRSGVGSTCIRFDAVIPDGREGPPRSAQKLRAEYPGILQWAIEGRSRTTGTASSRLRKS